MMIRYDEIRALAEKGRGKKWGHPDRVAFRDRADETFALEVLARVEVLKAGLREYGKHSVWCHFDRPATRLHAGYLCTCGLDALRDIDQKVQL